MVEVLHLVYNQTDKGTDIWTDRKKDKQTDDVLHLLSYSIIGFTKGQMDATEKQASRHLDRWMNGKIDRWVYGHTDVKTDRYKDGQTD